MHIYTSKISQKYHTILYKYHINKPKRPNFPYKTPYKSHNNLRIIYRLFVINIINIDLFYAKIFESLSSL